jgi:alpha-galactosidase
MKKVTFIGGGSAKFVRELVVDMFHFPELQDCRISLMDIDGPRAQRSEKIVRKIIADRKLPATVESTTDQRHALEGADYVVITIMVGGFESYRLDYEVPAKYGVLQGVSDTIGPGGVFRIVRTSPVLQQIAANLRQVAPDAQVLNYANPMAMNTWTLLTCGHQRTVGLCHSIQGCYAGIAKTLGIDPAEINYTAAGINHVDFYIRLERNGQDLYPLLKAAAEEELKKHPDEKPRFELLEYLGHFPAEGPCHQSEYYPWFRKNQQTIDQYSTQNAWGYHIDMKMNEQKIADIEDQIAGRKPISYTPSEEYGAKIIHSLETGQLRLFYGNVRNEGLIDNLPREAVVEVPCAVDKNGIQPVKVGNIPPQLAAVMRPHISVHELAVQGALTKNRRLIEQAVMMDPLTGAILTLPKIRAMVKEMFEINKDYVADWK